MGPGNWSTLGRNLVLHHYLQLAPAELRVVRSHSCFGALAQATKIASYQALLGHKWSVGDTRLLACCP